MFFYDIPENRPCFCHYCGKPAKYFTKKQIPICESCKEKFEKMEERKNEGHY